MRQMWPVLPALLAALWSCRSDHFPTGERTVAVPVERLATSAARSRGRILYRQHCALCHGERGDGRGPRQNLSSSPRNFTDRAWRRQTGPRRVFVAIRDGVRGTAMPAWKNLDEEQTWDLVAYLLSISSEGP